MKTNSKTSISEKAQYAFCIISATYFIGRCVATWCFNI